MHEIVTLQFGQRANYVATHFWNIQESYFTYSSSDTNSIDHDIHFRAGLGHDNTDTYTPRTVIYDLKANFGSLKRLNALYEDPAQQITALWQKPAQLLQSTQIPQAQYQVDLDLGQPTRQLTSKDVRYWSDFNRVFYHPRSIVQLGAQSLGSSLSPFETWQTGVDLFADTDRDADLLDRDVRLFTEECDQMQGFQIFSGVNDAWGGWTKQYIDALRDEYGKKNILVWGLEDSRRVDRQKALIRVANAARTLNGISDLVSGYCRVGNSPEKLPRYVQLDANSEWETSALSAITIESLTLPTRLKDDSSLRALRYGELEQLLNTNGGQNIFDLGLTIADQAEQDTNTAQHDTRMQNGDDEATQQARRLDIGFTPSLLALMHDQARSNPHVFAQALTTRHPPHHPSQLIKPPNREDQLRLRYNDETIIDHLDIPLQYPDLDSLPSNLLTYDSRDTRVTAGLCSRASTKQTVTNMRDLAVRFSRNVDVDEREVLYDGLTGIAEKYDFGWDDDSNEDD